jgi:hypothetical protein
MPFNVPYARSATAKSPPLKLKLFRVSPVSSLVILNVPLSWYEALSRNAGGRFLQSAPSLPHRTRLPQAYGGLLNMLVSEVK